MHLAVIWYRTVRYRTVLYISLESCWYKTRQNILIIRYRYLVQYNNLLIPPEIHIIMEIQVLQQSAWRLVSWLSLQLWYYGASTMIIWSLFFVALCYICSLIWMKLGYHLNGTSTIILPNKYRHQNFFICRSSVLPWWWLHTYLLHLHLHYSFTSYRYR